MCHKNMYSYFFRFWDRFFDFLFSNFALAFTAFRSLDDVNLDADFEPEVASFRGVSDKEAEGGRLVSVSNKLCCASAMLLVFLRNNPPSGPQSRSLG